MSDQPRLRPPLIGREEQLERMMDKLALALAGNGTVIMISGEAGSGKTRLAEEFQQLASRTRCVCVSATCAPDQAAYAPFRTALIALSKADPSISAIPSYQELCQDGGREQSDMVEGEKVERSLFSVQEVLRVGSGKFPVVLRVDDLQLADARTIQMLHFLARDVVNHRVIIICTFSDDELFDRFERPHPLIDSMRIMKREGLCIEIRLPPLSEDQLAEALGGLLERELEDQALKSLLRESGGNPQIAIELTLEALRSGALVLGQQKASMESWRTLGIPLSLREWVGRKLDSLPEDQLQVLQCAALSGHRFDAELLSRALGKQKLETLELLDTAVRDYRLYIEAGDGYQFRLAVVRRVAADRIPPTKATELRQAIAMAGSDGDNST